MYTKLPSLPKICYCVLNPKCCFEYRDKISLFSFVLNWQLLFNIVGVQTHCLYKLLWLCIVYWMGCVEWIIKVVHFLYRSMFPLALLFMWYVLAWNRRIVLFCYIPDAHTLFTLKLKGIVLYCLCGVSLAFPVSRTMWGPWIHTNKTGTL